MYRLFFISIFPAVFSGCLGTAPAENTASAPGFLIKGVSVVAPVKPVDSTVFTAIENINANSIAVMPYAFCSPEKPQVKYNHHGQWWGENDEGVIRTIQLAHQKKLAVMLKPHLWIAHGMYTGVFKLNTNQDWRLWEESYREYILHFATIADSLKAEFFCLGTELGAAVKERPQFWSALIESIRKTYHGRITYAANWDDYNKFPFWDNLDYIGVDAYFPLTSEKTPNVTSLRNEWQKYSNQLEKLSSRHKIPVLFTEYGYRNVDHTAEEPWKENKGEENETGQANALEALYQTLSGKQWFAGGFIWKWYIDTGRHPREKIDFTPQGKAGETVIRKWYQKVSL